MKNIVGQTPRGRNFYQRADVLKLLYKRLENAGSLYMAAPRRMGKTAIMRYLEDNKTDGYCAVYIITESVHDSEQFFKVVLDELLRSDALGELKKLSKNIGDFLDGFIARFKKVSAFGVGIELNDPNNSYYAELEKLLRNLSEQETSLKLVIMIDEFPQTVENILRKHGDAAVIEFLQHNRELRQHTNNNNAVSFLLTGSIGLPALIERLRASVTINDLSVFDIPPLKREDAKDLLNRLLTNNLAYQDNDLETVLNKLEWFSPYHIQLLAQEFIHQYQLNQIAINESSIEQAFQVITSRRNDINFIHYYSRLETSFNTQELKFAKALLKTLCQQSAVTTEQIDHLATENSINDVKFILRALEFDGYIFRSQDGWRFNSPILKRWWYQYVCY